MLSKMPVIGILFLVLKILHVDQTNITRERRRFLVRLAEENGYEAVAMVMETNQEICKARAAETGQEDLISVIEEFSEQFEPVSEDEGFNEVICIRNS